MFKVNFIFYFQVVGVTILRFHNMHLGESMNNKQYMNAYKQRNHVRIFLLCSNYHQDNPITKFANPTKNKRRSLSIGMQSPELVHFNRPPLPKSKQINTKQRENQSQKSFGRLILKKYFDKVKQIPRRGSSCPETLSFVSCKDDQTRP